MNSRERIIAALTFSRPDRVPVMHRTLPGGFRVHGEKLQALYRTYPSDIMLSPSSNSPFAFSDVDSEHGGAGTMTDVWGCTWLKTSDDWQGRVVEFPLADWSALRSYRWPDAMTGYAGVEEMMSVMKEDRHQHYYLGACGTLMHQMTFLRGFEETLIDLYEGNQEILVVRDRITEIILRRIEVLTKAGADGILLNDDWGTQTSLFIKPALWRELFKPAYKKMVDAAHSGGAYAHMHFDGVTDAIVPDLIEIGLEELNPQVWCMNVDDLSRRYRGKACFRADLDRQHILCRGTPAEVVEHVWQTYQAFGLPTGGYIGYGQVGPDTPIENVEAMLRTFAALRPGVRGVPSS